MCRPQEKLSWGQEDFHVFLLLHLPSRFLRDKFPTKIQTYVLGYLRHSKAKNNLFIARGNTVERKRAYEERENWQFSITIKTEASSGKISTPDRFKTKD